MEPFTHLKIKNSLFCEIPDQCFGTCKRDNGFNMYGLRSSPLYKQVFHNLEKVCTTFDHR